MQPEKALLAATFKNGTKNYFACLFAGDMTIQPRVGQDFADDFLSLRDLASFLKENGAKDITFTLTEHPHVTSALDENLAIVSIKPFETHIQATEILSAKKTAQEKSKEKTKEKSDVRAAEPLSPAQKNNTKKDGSKKHKPAKKSKPKF